MITIKIKNVIATIAGLIGTATAIYLLKNSTKTTSISPKSTVEPEKLFALAQHAFAGKYPDEELRRVRDLFMRRFFTQQFKRTAGPDGIQAGVVSLSARGAWMMPSDINGNLWRR